MAFIELRQSQRDVKEKDRQLKEKDDEIAALKAQVLASTERQHEARAG